MVLSEKNRWKLIFLETVQRDQLILQHLFQQEFFFEPHRHGGKKGLHSLGRKRDISLQQTLELDQRLVVENEIFEVRQGDAALAETIAHRVNWKPRIEFFACEALFLSGRNDLTIADQAC